MKRLRHGSALVRVIWSRDGKRSFGEDRPRGAQLVDVDQFAGDRRSAVCR